MLLLWFVSKRSSSKKRLWRLKSNFKRANFMVLSLQMDDLTSGKPLMRLRRGELQVKMEAFREVQSHLGSKGCRN